MASCENCKTGFAWNGTPTGSETTLAGLPTYVTGTSKSAAVLFVHDIFGWTFRNNRILADHFAKEANATVYVPDFFNGDVVSEDTLVDPEKRAAFDIGAFISPHNKGTRYPDILAAAKALKAEYPKLGAVGYCYGGWAIFRLGSDPTLVDAVATAHPSMLEKSDIDNIKVPIQILSPESDHAYSPELKEYSNKVIPEKGVPYEYIFFPGLAHGFATRGDTSNKLQKDGLERAKRSVVNFFNEFLH